MSELSHLLRNPSASGSGLCLEYNFILHLGVTLELSVPSLTADVCVSCTYATQSAMMLQTGSSVGMFKCFSGALLVSGAFLAMTKHLIGTLQEEGLFLGHSSRV